MWLDCFRYVTWLYQICHVVGRIYLLPHYRAYFADMWASVAGHTQTHIRTEMTTNLARGYSPYFAVVRQIRIYTHTHTHTHTHAYGSEREFSKIYRLVFSLLGCPFLYLFFLNGETKRERERKRVRERGTERRKEREMCKCAETHSVPCFFKGSPMWSLWYFAGRLGGA